MAWLSRQGAASPQRELRQPDLGAQGLALRRSWIAWAMRSRLEAVKRVARMVRDHLYGIANAIVLGASNASAESTSAKIQRVKRRACGFCSRERFRTAIYFYLGGGLDTTQATHTTP